MSDKKLFIVVEGIDGCGKDTLIDNIVKTYKGYVKTRNISDRPLGRGIRGMVGNHDSDIINRFMHNHIGVAHMFLSELFVVQEEVKDLLKEDHVICSRWHYSTMAYIGDSPKVIDIIKEADKELLQPDLIIRLRLPVELALERMAKRNQKIEFFEKRDKLEVVSKRYDNLISLYGKDLPILHIPVEDLDKEEVLENVMLVINRFLKNSIPGV